MASLQLFDMKSAIISSCMITLFDDLKYC